LPRKRNVTVRARLRGPLHFCYSLCVRRFLALFGLTIAAAAITLLAQQQQPLPLPPATPQNPQQRALTTVVLDPSHGGADPGARGANGVVEKDVVLAYARLLRVELERGGFRVVMTRDGDQNPTFDERDAIANAQHGAIFISLHVSSTGQPGAPRAYSYQFSEAPESVPASSPATSAARSTAAGQPQPQPTPMPAPAPAPPGWTLWETAQMPYEDMSRRLAGLVEVELSQKFAASSPTPGSAAVRELRSVMAPAVAVEISSVTAADEKSLEAMGPSVAIAIGRAVTAFRPLYESGAK
jgi:N-acetylmuramoyl-L-alanine amidase